VQAAEYSLEDLCRTALERSERLKIAEENLTISQLGSDKALSALLPRLTATAGLVSYSQEKYNEARTVIHPTV
jgi:outer membrane protein